ncbi:uncharacterized protein LY89DRAFT_689215 [Mollisia scopiformis]|uniref:Extracellular serine-rich protein n=1 Tax=Mollisia scopiformis TaxID=149040 RepID=A0A194WUJ8_MOLSC|nr:uncharacterized protein LY89DRAFT_689215 [Mollisia scopiformis]KUJ11344.1 hypothetical protein LY89DRAFT_689215 [Mollisia scopiformis]
MLLNIVALISVSLFNIVVAQTASSTTSAPAATHTVSVGADGLNFNPHEITGAAVGDIIEYRFYPQNHSVARAAFGPNPCIPYEDTGAGLVGFWSGFQPIAVVLNDPPIFRVRVNDTAPIFYYCSAPNACFEGMIGVINPNATETFQAQFNYTQNATLEFSPLEYFPAEVSATRTTTATGATMTPTAPPSTSSTAPASSSSHTSLGAGPIAGIAIGGFAVAVLAAALIYMCGRHKTINELMLRQSTLAASNHNSYQPASAGLTEANYSNMQKTPMSDAARFSDRETASYRSMSPPLDERSAMMGMQPMHFQGQGNGSPGLGVMSPGSPGYPSPTYYDTQTPHEMENGTVQSQAGLRQNPPPEHEGPHELAVGDTNVSTMDSRPFSYTDSESGFHAERKQ